MDYQDMAKAILICGSEPSVRRCESECPYFKNGDIKECIPRMTDDISKAIITLLERVEVAEKERDIATKQLHGKCYACKHYSAYHRKGKCKNCCWDNANPACLREYQEDCWEWNGGGK